MLVYLKVQNKLLLIYNFFSMATKAKYFRVRPEEDKNEVLEDTDILLKSSPTYGKYISRALTLFFGEDKQSVTIKAAQRVIEKAFWVAEVLKTKVQGLHQITTLTEKKVVDIFEPKEEGLLRVEKARFLTLVEITLTLKPTGEEKKSIGYQPPVKGEKSDFLTKEKWEENEKEFKERKESRPPKNENRNQERGSERRRGRRNNNR